MVGGEGFIHGIDCPDNWQFPNWLDWRSIKDAITDGHSLLVYRLTDKGRIDPKNFGDCGVIYFGEDGQPQDYLRHSTYDTAIRLMRDDSQIHIDIHQWPFGTLTDANFEIKYDPPIPSEHGVGAHAIASADYNFGKLGSVAFGKCFDNTTSSIRSPLVVVSSSKGVFSFNPYLEEGYQFVETDTPNQTQILHDGKPEFVCNLDIKGYRQRLMTTDALMFGQTHIDTGKVKILVAPMRLDMKRIVQAAYVPLPTQAQVDGGYNPSWKNIDQASNIHLVYK